MSSTSPQEPASAGENDGRSGSAPSAGPWWRLQTDAGGSPGVRGIPVSEVLALPSLTGATVLAGAGGLGRMVRFVNIMEGPDVLSWTKADEFMLTTGYPLRASPDALTNFVADMDARGLAGVAVKLGRYLDELPASMLQQADDLDFPVVLLANGTGFDDVLNQTLTAVLGQQATLLARGEQAHAELLQVVLDGGGVQEVAEALPAQLAGPDRQDRVTVLHVDRTGRVTVRAGAPLPEGEAGLFDADDLFRSTAFVHGIHRVGDTSVIVASVAAEGDHGRIVAVRTDLTWDLQDLIALERGATTAALVITREVAVQTVEGKYRGDFLRDVLAGRITADAALVGARGFGWDLAGPMVVVVAAADTSDSDESGRRRRAEQLAVSWAAWVRRQDPAAAAAAFAAEAVAVLHTPDGRVPSGERIGELLGGLSSPGNPFDGVVGVSRVVTTADELAKAYTQAWEAVRVGRRLSGPGSVSRFDDLGLYRLLSLVGESTELRSFLFDTLGPLAAPDGDAESDELRRTLTMLLDTNLNVAETARRLHFHYNTLRYRITKLERLLGPFTTDARLRADLTVALYVWQMRVAHH